MIKYGASECPECGGKLHYYDNTKRIVKVKEGEKLYFTIRRFRCLACGKIHREIPDYIIPYKQYAANVIHGVLDGSITPDTIGFEDYPCEMTMNRWINSRKLHTVL